MLTGGGLVALLPIARPAGALAQVPSLRLAGSGLQRATMPPCNSPTCRTLHTCRGGPAMPPAAADWRGSGGAGH